MSRPELTAPAYEFYNAAEARKYTSSSRVIEIQNRLTERAVELLNFPSDGVPRLLLDIGCGSGLSGDCLTRLGHEWIGTDLSLDMLAVARERFVAGCLINFDMGHGCPFRPGVFDGCISISAVQWLCNADNYLHDPRKRLAAFFTQLYRCLKRGAKAVLQFYPECPKQAEMITSAALSVGFSGGLVVDYQNSTRAKKYFLVLAAGHPDSITSDNLENRQESTVVLSSTVPPRATQCGRPNNKQKSILSQKSEGHGKSWILRNKERALRKGKRTASDSKYVGRKRKDRF